MTYYIVEDITDAATRLQHEMAQHVGWTFAGHAKGVKQAKKEIGDIKPNLIFCDWDIIGGSGFEVLQHISFIKDYDPFIIFNTGFQSDHPEIAEALINTYKPDAYIAKPYWQKLREQLEGLLQKAALKIQQKIGTAKTVWLTADNGHKIAIVPQEITCILQPISNPRNKTLYTITQPLGVEISFTWKEAHQLLDAQGINYFTTNKRFSLVVKSFIDSYFPPIVYLKNSGIKVEIVAVAIKDFEHWLAQESR